MRDITCSGGVMRVHGRGGVGLRTDEPGLPLGCLPPVVGQHEDHVEADEEEHHRLEPLVRHRVVRLEDRHAD